MANFAVGPEDWKGVPGGEFPGGENPMATFGIRAQLRRICTGGFVFSFSSWNWLERLLGSKREPSLQVKRLCVVLTSLERRLWLSLSLSLSPFLTDVVVVGGLD
uniref:Uncharacterized protein n=1 Tax=Physcomitrium patens TaxID=3218 RepID=A0A2K1K3W6_PHYPA|nr:hypothetical protein PHYPA_012948 [Physcomitrium patens]